MRSSIVVLFALSLAACRPDVESTVPCAELGDRACPTGWRCAEDGFCEEGEAPPDVVFETPASGTVVAGMTQVAFTASSARGLVSARLQLARDGARRDINVTADLAADGFTGRFTAEFDSAILTDGDAALVATVTAAGGPEGSATQSLTIRNGQ